ncbi:MAG: hypothetical protein M3317_13665 [Actinomycetota bacterium]|nr:hypothetical protein [Actinomycetota bacterium]
MSRTVVVSPVGTDAENGTALINALAAISDASQTKKYLLYVEPGTYDLGSATLQMKEHVDIEGAGELSTLITSGVARFNVPAGTVLGADNAELRFLTVRNTGIGAVGSWSAAILNLATSPRLTHVTAEVIAVRSINIGVFNALSAGTPIMTDVTATASGDATNIGVENVLCSPTIKQSKLSGSNNSLLHARGGTTTIALTQLVGPIETSKGGAVRCFNNYDENLAAVACP